MYALGTHRGQSKPSAQGVVVGQQPLDLAPERQRIRQVHDPDCAPSNLVLVGRPDAASRAADAGQRIRGFAHGIKLLVQRQDQRGVLRDAQAVRGDINALLPEPVDFLEQRERINDDAVADHGQLSRPHHA